MPRFKTYLFLFFISGCWRFLFSNQVLITNTNVITAYEYWFDQNYPQKVTVSTSPSSVIILTSSISASSLQPGVHSFNIRFKDAYGQWSIVQSDLFYKPFTQLNLPSNQLVAYEYWFDQNYAQKVTVSTSPSSVIVLTSSLSTSLLQPGVHSFNIRFKDAYGQWSIVQSDLFYKSFTQLNLPSNQLVAYEYWFDQNYAQKVTVSTSPSSVIVLTSSLSTSSLQPGVHSFNIRFKDAYGQWSIVQSDLFYKPFTQLNLPSNQLVAYEYWFDQNYAQKVIVSTSPSSVIILTSSISTSSLQPGVHSFNIRFKDAFGQWSIVQSDLFYKSFSQPNQQSNQLMAYEYWFDQNYAQKVTVSTSPSSVIVLTSSISTASLQPGVHSFNIRFKDTYGQWSIVQSELFYKSATNQNVNSNKISGYRYWIDTLFSKRVIVTFSVPVNPYVLNTPITMTNIPKGMHTFNIQFMDSMKRWSIAQTDTFQKNSLPISIFTVNNNVFCNYGVVSFTNQSVDGDVYLWNFGDNTTSTLTNVTHTYNAIGNYTVSLTITDTIIQVSNTQTMLIIISGDPIYSLGNDTTVCPNSNFQLQALPNQSLYLWNTGATTSVINTPTAGQYWCEVTNNYGCKWKDTINIQFHPLTQSSFTFSSNNLSFQFTNTSSNAISYYWNFGDGNSSTLANPSHTYLLPGSYTVMLVASGKCGNDTSYHIVNALNVGFVNLDKKDSDIRLFPNPSKGEFNLLINNVEGKHLTINIYSPEGKFIDQWSEYSNDDEFNKSYDFKTLSDGIYLINVIIDNKTVYKSKLIIMK